MEVKQLLRITALQAVVLLFGSLSLDSSRANASPVDAAELSLLAEQCPKGKEFIAHPRYCTKYFQCVEGIPVENKCPDGTVFAETFSLCVEAGSDLDTCTPAHPYRECKRHTVDLIPDATRCQGYYNCSEYVNVPWNVSQTHWAHGYERECDWPQYFCLRARKCVDYKTAVCGTGREETKWYCDYYASQCTRCVRCYFLNPSCVGKEDGLYPSKWSYWSHYYYKCEDERDWKGLIKCPHNKIFDAKLRKCIYDFKVEDADKDEIKDE